jgi:hypothetical protein
VWFLPTWNSCARVGPLGRTSESLRGGSQQGALLREAYVLSLRSLANSRPGLCVYAVLPLPLCLRKGTYVTGVSQSAEEATTLQATNRKLKRSVKRLKRFEGQLSARGRHACTHRRARVRVSHAHASHLSTHTHTHSHTHTHTHTHT